MVTTIVFYEARGGPQADPQHGFFVRPRSDPCIMPRLDRDLGTWASPSTEQLASARPAQRAGLGAGARKARQART